MFTPPNEQDEALSNPQSLAPGIKGAAEQPVLSGFCALNPAKIQRECFRVVGTVLTAAGVDASPWIIEVQKARLFEAIVEQHKSDIQKELGITLDVWTHGADLQRYAAEQEYLGDTSHMSEIEGRLRTNALQGPKLVLSMSSQPAATPPVIEGREESEERKKEGGEVVVQRPAETPQARGFEQSIAPVVPDYPKILKLMEEYRESELAKFKAGQETAEAIVRHLAPYEEIEEKIRQKVAEPQTA
ncbi:MAG TPA: hypothetical protein VNK03_07900 [Gammaproteobacteria bacterium]|nr:hypothetical protein [Gammaproteobacteria bacterium]